MIKTYTYICNSCQDKPCQVSIRAEDESVMGRRCKECGWTPKSICYIEQEKTKNWVLYSIIPDGVL